VIDMAAHTQATETGSPARADADPAAGARSRTLTLDPLPQAVGVTRAQLARLLPMWGMADLVDAAVLIASELVTNALRSHRPVRFTARAAGGGLRIEVHDQCSEPPRPCRATPYDEDGRGLLLVAAYADRWGHTPMDDGKIVWATLPKTDPPHNPRRSHPE
jgi:anti-sigma regulatory factor (Ser/Thr protein kinase)